MIFQTSMMMFHVNLQGCNEYMFFFHVKAPLKITREHRYTDDEEQIPGSNLYLKMHPINVSSHLAHVVG